MIDILEIHCDDYESSCIKDELYGVENFDGVLNLINIDENGDGVLDQGLFILVDVKAKRFD